MFLSILLFVAICTVSTEEESNFRLPEDLVPIHYKLNVMADLNHSKYNGKVWITIRCSKETPTIKLHSKGLKIYVIGHEKVSVTENINHSEVDISGTEQKEENDHFVITLSKPLEKGRIYVLYLSFKGSLDMTGEGFFRANYKDSTGSTRWYALTEFKTGARNAFPCFDEPHFRATFFIQIGVKPSFTPVSNMLLTNDKDSARSESQLGYTSIIQHLKSFFQILLKDNKTSVGFFSYFRCFICDLIKKFSVKVHKRIILHNSFHLVLTKHTISLEDMAVYGQPLGNFSRKKITKTDTVWYNFQQTPPILPHQVSLVISSLDHREVKFPWTSVSLHLWAQTNAISLLEDATSNPGRTASVIPRFVVFFKDFFNIDCPLPKIDLVSIQNSGYIASFGIITEMEAVLLSSVEMREANRLAHDVANLWVDGLVTFSWWSDLWYTWALAEHLATLAMQHVFPNWNIVDRVLVSRVESIYNEDSMEATTVFMPITVPEEIFGSYYNNIFFDKGPVLIRMVHLHLGDKAFKKGLSNFLLKFKHSSAATNDLWTSLTEAAHETKVLPIELNLQQIMDNWITKTGFPIVTVTRDYRTSEITVSQKHFIKDGSEEEEPNNDCWWVPLTYITDRDPEFSDITPKHWLNCEEKELSFHIQATDSEWVIFNNRMAGLYRVNYDIKNWNLIAAAISKPDFSKINLLNRVQLLTDSWDFVKIGILEYKTTFSILNFLQFENEYLPWKVALVRLKEIKEKLYRTPKYDIFKHYMQKIVTGVFEKFEEFDQSQGKEEKLERRYVVKWACELNVAKCKQKAEELFLEWKNSHKSVPKDIRRMVFCKGVEEDGDNWEFLQKYYKTIDDSDERKHILFALSCTKDANLLKRYLEWSIGEGSPIPPQFCFDAFRKVVKNEIGYNIAWKFFFNNIRRISHHSGRGDDVLTMYVTALAEQIVSDEELNKLKDIVKKNEELLQNIEEELEDAFNDVEERLSWLRKNYTPLIEAIEQIKL